MTTKNSFLAYIGVHTFVFVTLSFSSMLCWSDYPGYFNANSSARFKQWITRQGRFFSATMPSTWRPIESQNGLDIIAPDGRTGYTFILLMGGYGYMTPQKFISWRLRYAGIRDARWINIKRLPDQPGPMGYRWRVYEFELTFTFKGRRVRAYSVCGVIQGAGQYSVVMRSFQAPIYRWNQIKSRLARIDRSVRIINARQVAGLDRVRLPRGIRHDEIYGNFNRANTQRQHAHDALSKKRREGTMGVTRMKDPVTGKIYDIRNDQYDPKIGGYRNPQRPTERLVPTEPGE